MVKVWCQWQIKVPNLLVVIGEVAHTMNAGNMQPEQLEAEVVLVTKDRTVESELGRCEKVGAYSHL
jgi:hypothetical protein